MQKPKELSKSGWAADVRKECAHWMWGEKQIQGTDLEVFVLARCSDIPPPPPCNGSQLCFCQSYQLL